MVQSYPGHLVLVRKWDHKKSNSRMLFGALGVRFLIQAFGSLGPYREACLCSSYMDFCPSEPEWCAKKACNYWVFCGLASELVPGIFEPGLNAPLFSNFSIRKIIKKFYLLGVFFSDSTHFLPLEAPFPKIRKKFWMGSLNRNSTVLSVHP